MGRRRRRFKPWSRRKTRVVAYLTGLGWNSTMIAEHLHDGTMDETIRRQWALWGVPPRDGETRFMSVPIQRLQQVRLAELARTRRLTPEHWAGRVLDAAVRDDLFSAIVGDDE